jgi:nucleoside-diphosphate-sugar epimerase
VRRLVLASSIQAVSGYPEGVQIRPGDPPRPANLYGATKAWAEALGAWVATTSETSVVVLRIGAFRLGPPAGDGASAPDQAAWLGPEDGAELVRAAVEGEGFCLAVAQGVSGPGTPRFPHGWAVLPVSTQGGAR